MQQLVDFVGHGLVTVGDPRVEFTVLRIDRRLDLRGIGWAWLDAVEWHPGSKIEAHAHRQKIDDAATKAEADGAEFAAAVGLRFQPFCVGQEVFPHFGSIELTEKRRSLLVVSGIAAQRGQSIGGESDEIGDRQLPPDWSTLPLAVVLPTTQSRTRRRIRRHVGSRHPCRTKTPPIRR